MVSALLLACADPPPPPDPTVPLTVTPPPGAPACDPPLALAPAVAYAEPHRLVQLVGSGGTGAYTFALGDGASGTIEPDLGSYLAGAEVGVVDTVRLTDAACLGSAEAEVHTVAPLSVLPEVLTVAPGTTFTPEITGGSGLVSCALDGAGTLDGCTYTAGDAGTDVIVVSDAGLGTSVDVVVDIDPDATWTVEGDEAWFVPLGATFAPHVDGGSGVVDLVSSDEDVLLAIDGAVVAVSAGVATIEVRDRFAGGSIEVRATVLAPFAPPSPRFGLRSNTSSAAWAGDLDGDGYADAVVAFPEISLGATQDGAVLVYRGQPGGFDPDPVQVFAGESRLELAGRGLLVEDLDGDGLVDLAFGADGADLGMGDQGVVRIHPGLPGGWFSDVPAAELAGGWFSDRLGTSIAACDLNGDGLQDLLVGAHGSEERVGVGYPTDIGGVFWYLRGADGLPTQPSGSRFGEVPDGLGGWARVTGANFGLFALAAGDFDGDGLCDVALGTPGYRLDGVNGQGAVLVYAGDADVTLTEHPVAFYANLDPTDLNGNFGRGLRAADFDGDGADELVISQPFADLAPINDRGAVRIFAGGPFAGGVIPATDADWTWLSPESSEFTSLAGALQVDDLNGDGVPDLAFGVPNGDGPVAADAFGLALLFDGTSIVLDGRSAATETPWVSLAGDQLGGFFGQSVAFVPDLGSDGLPDALVLAARHDALGFDVGLVLSATSDAPPVQLGLPGEASGHDHTRGLAVFGGVVIGSPGDNFGTGGPNTGTVTAFAPGADVGAPFGGGVANHGGGDARGYIVADLGDFDGDGYADLAVVSRADSQPTAFDAQYANPTACPGVAGLNGAVGSVAIHRGGPAGPSGVPTWVWYGPVVNGNVRALAGRFDYDGDGFGDFAAGSRSWFAGSQGGFAVVRGRPAPSSGIQVICPSEAEVYFGEQASSSFGEAIASPGDVDGDGCGDVAVGAPLEDVIVGVGTLPNAGVVRIFYGHGPACATTTQRVATASDDIVLANAGTSLAGGVDFDGDGTGDLAIGGSAFRVLGTEVGAAWVAPGAHLASLPTTVATAGAALVGTSATRGPLVPPDDGVYGVFGRAPTGKFGDAVEVGTDGLGRAFLAVGAFDGDAGGVSLSGGVYLFRWDEGGLRATPFAVVGGEGHLLGGDLGDTLSFGVALGEPTLAVGAPLSSQLGLQTGAAYAVPLGAP